MKHDCKNSCLLKWIAVSLSKDNNKVKMVKFGRRQYIRLLAAALVQTVLSCFGNQMQEAKGGRSRQSLQTSSHLPPFTHHLGFWSIFPAVLEKTLQTDGVFHKIQVVLERLVVYFSTSPSCFPKSGIPIPQSSSFHKSSPFNHLPFTHL